MKKLLDQLNIIFGAGWDEIHDLAGIGGEQIEKMLLQLQKDMHDTVEMVLEYINFGMFLTKFDIQIEVYN